MNSNNITITTETQINNYLTSQNVNSLAKSTKRLYTVVLKTKFLPFCIDNNILVLDSTIVEYFDKFIEYLTNQNLTSQSIQQYLIILKFFLKKINITVSYTYKIPRDSKQKHALKHQNRWFTSLNIAQCKTYVFSKNHIRNRILVRILCETGARINEISNIKISDINLNSCEILLSVSKTTPRLVFISQDTGLYIEKYFKEKNINPTSNNTLFPSANQIWRIVIDMLTDLKLKSKGDGRGPHTFRHYVATQLYFSKGMDLTEVAFLLGDKPETISNNYLHPDSTMLRTRMQKFQH